MEEPSAERVKRIDFRDQETKQGALGKLSLDERKESSARLVALIITWTFSASSLLILIGVYRILRWMPSEAEGLISRAAIPLLEKAGLFLSSTFGPLLAFVLGYYFGEKGRSQGGTAN